MYSAASDMAGAMCPDDAKFGGKVPGSAPPCTHRQPYQHTASDLPHTQLAYTLFCICLFGTMTSPLWQDALAGRNATALRQPKHAH